jgi:hypothetical protein
MDQGEPDNRHGDGSSAPEPLAALAALREAALGALETPLWPLADGVLRAAVTEGFAAMNQAYAAYLRLIHELDSRPGSVEGARPGTTARTFLVHALRRSPFQASADVQAATALAPGADPAHGGLPRLGAALAAGRISREHAHVAVKAVRRLPGHLLRETLTADEATEAGLSGPNEDADGAADAADAGGAASFCRGDLLDQLLADHCQQHDPATIDRLGEYLQHAADPDGSHSFDPEATQRRGLSITRDSTGMEIIRGELDPIAGALVRAALDALGRPRATRTETADDGTLIEIKDQRTARQRNADAAGEMARLALGALREGHPHEPPRLVLHTTAEEVAAAQAAATSETGPATGDSGHEGSAEGRVDEGGVRSSSSSGDTGGDGASGSGSTMSWPGGGQSFRPNSLRPAWRGSQLATGGSVPPAVLAQFACDAVLQKALLAPTGAILDLGRKTRTVTPAQRRALVARDKGCVVPACRAPAHWCEAHHVTYWRHGGRTDIRNLAMVCGRHHTEIHAGIWHLTMRDGIPWAIPPSWVDPLRRPIRNTYRDDAEAFHHTGIQLRLGFDPPGPPRPKRASPEPPPAEPPDQGVSRT